MLALIRKFEIALCAVRGHELIKKATKGNLHTECLRCPYKSTGIQIGKVKAA